MTRHDEDPPAGPRQNPRSSVHQTGGTPLNRLDLARTYTAGTTPPSGTCAAAPALACYDYALDAVGNRTALTVRGSTLTAADYTFAYNDANRAVLEEGRCHRRTDMRNGSQRRGGL